MQLSQADLEGKSSPKELFFGNNNNIDYFNFKIIENFSEYRLIHTVRIIYKGNFLNVTPKTQNIRSKVEKNFESLKRGKKLNP